MYRVKHCTLYVIMFIRYVIKLNSLKVPVKRRIHIANTTIASFEVLYLIVLYIIYQFV